MSDKSVFTDDEWEAVTEAPLLIAMAMTAVGPHGLISMTKESFASAKAMTMPGDHGAANALIAEIVQVAKGKETRHDVKDDIKDHNAQTIPVLIDKLVGDLAPAAAALRKLPADEADGVRAWLSSIAVAIADAAKGTTAEEQAVIDRIGAALA